MSNVDKLRLNFLEEELKHCTSRLSSYEKSTSFILAQLQLINNWIESTFETQLIDTSSTPYRNWIQNYNLSQIKTIAQKIKWANTKLATDKEDIDPHSPGEDTDSHSIENGDDPLLAVKNEPLEQEYREDEDVQTSLGFIDLQQQNLDPLNRDADTSLNYTKPFVVEEVDDFEFAPNTSAEQSKAHERCWSWNYFITIRDTENNNKIVSNRCKACGQGVSAEATRLRKHLAKCTNNATDQVILPVDFPINSVDLPKDTTNGSIKAGRKLTHVWKYFNTIKDKETNKIISNTCKACGNKVSPEARRLNNHLAKCTRNANNQHNTHIDLIVSSEDLGADLDTNNSRVKSGRKLAPVWKYFSTIKDKETNKIISNKCKACGNKVSPEARRLNNHLAKCINNSTSQGSIHVDVDLLVNSENTGQGAEDTSASGGEKRGRRLKSVWKYFNTTKDKKSNKIVSNTCKGCGKRVSPEAKRLSNHLTKCHVFASSFTTTTTTKNSTSKNQSSDKNKASVTESRQFAITSPNKSSLEGGEPESSQNIITSTAENSVGRVRTRTISTVWSYFNTVRTSNNKLIISNTCKNCHKSVTPKPYRLRHHLVKCIGLHVEEEQQQQPKVSKAIQKAELASHFVTTSKESLELEASAESNLKPIATTISTCKKCGVSMRSSIKVMIDHLSRCEPMLGKQYKGLIRRRKVKEGTQCEECGKILIGDINRHMLTHLELRPCNCGTCGKGFRTKSSLKLHILSVHKGVRIPRAKRQRRTTKVSN